MVTYTKPSEVTERCKYLENLWLKRNQNIAGWYDTLALYDELKQENMEKDSLWWQITSGNSRSNLNQLQVL